MCIFVSNGLVESMGIRLPEGGLTLCISGLYIMGAFFLVLHDVQYFRISQREILLGWYHVEIEFLKRNQVLNFHP